MQVGGNGEEYTVKLKLSPGSTCMAFNFNMVWF